REGWRNERGSLKREKERLRQNEALEIQKSDFVHQAVDMLLELSGGSAASSAPSAPPSGSPWRPPASAPPLLSVLAGCAGSSPALSRSPWSACFSSVASPRQAQVANLLFLQRLEAGWLRMFLAQHQQLGFQQLVLLLQLLHALEEAGKAVFDVLELHLLPPECGWT
ncbi:hypothetical protein H1C71_000929, partial [Ictidomys tridecemlineatus]